MGTSNDFKAFKCLVRPRRVLATTNNENITKYRTPYFAGCFLIMVQVDVAGCTRSLHNIPPAITAASAFPKHPRACYSTFHSTVQCVYYICVSPHTGVLRAIAMENFTYPHVNSWTRTTYAARLCCFKVSRGSSLRTASRAVHCQPAAILEPTLLHMLLAC